MDRKMKKKQYDISENRRLSELLPLFKEKRILVFGDIMLDKYIWGDVSRISPEAPVQVVHVLEETFSPGGAANMATNAAALTASVSMVGLTGQDQASLILKEDLRRFGVSVDGLVECNELRTIEKVRIVGKGQQLLRVDYETKDTPSKERELHILRSLEIAIDQVDAVVISDYAKGVVTQNVCRALIGWANDRNKVVVVDPKPLHGQFYANATALTPNLSEAKQMAKMDDDRNPIMPHEAGAELCRTLNTNILVTLGENGMCLCEKNGDNTEIPPRRREVYSLVGAGDTVVACFTLALVSGAGFQDAAMLANVAAGIKVGKLGTATVTLDEIRAELENIRQ